MNTTLGNKPYIRVYVNIDEIHSKAVDYINERKPRITIFEGAATSDPIPVERYTQSLKRTIEFFGTQKYGKFRFVTKFTDIDSLLDIDHNLHTTFRFSLNTERVIKEYEHRTPKIEQRIIAASKVAQAGYPLGILIAPIFYTIIGKMIMKDFFYQ